MLSPTRPTRLLAGAAAGVLALSTAACGSSGKAATAGKSDTSALKTYTDVASLEAEAKKEGTVSVFMAPEFAPFLVKGFQKDYPWAKVNATGLEPPAAAAKWATELSANVHDMDVASIYITQVKQFTDKGAVAPVQLPNDSLVNPALQDSNHLFHATIEFPYVLLYNTKLVTDKPANLKELTDPKWKGKLVMDNPALGGPGGLTMAAMKADLGDQWEQWLKDLKANDVNLTDSSSASYDAVVRGERPLCICSYHDFIVQDAGTPVGVQFYNQDSTGVIPQAGTMEIAAKAPHPAMAALWINWVLSPTGGQAAIAGSGRTPVTQNVPGAEKVSVPNGVKVAPFSVLAEYLKDPNSFITVYRKTFGG